MYRKLIIIALNFFDFFNKKKIINFLIKKIDLKFNILIDVGAHHGESIKLFNKFFQINKVFAFEASPINFNKLVEYTNKDKKKNIEILNSAISCDQKYVKIQHFAETSSSTIVNINTKSNYFKRKKKILSPLKQFKPEVIFDVECLRLDNFIKNKQINVVDLIKIDTEGYDYNIMKSLGLKIRYVKAIYFEHHFHNMLNKGYNLSEVHDFLVKNNFRKAFKLKMFFRKTFEYIYLNKNFYE